MNSRSWSFYALATGLFTGRVFSGPSVRDMEQHKPPGCGAIEGRHDHLSKQVDIKTGEVIDWQPPQPDEYHEWDDVRKRWRLTATATELALQVDAAHATTADLEQNQQPRALREHILGNPESIRRLAEIDDQIAELRPLLRMTPPRLKR